MHLDRRRFIVLGLSSAAAAWPGASIIAQSSGSGRQIPSRVNAVRLSGEGTTIERAAIRELAESLRGDLLLNGDWGYDGARRLWNGMHDRYPALIVRPASTSDVAHAVDFAREKELLLAVKGGGHSWPGRSAADGALMIDLSTLTNVSVNPNVRRARVGGGALLYNLDFASLRHNLATTAGVVSHTGVGGLTLGGGYGRLGRKFGLTIDNLESAEIVTAAGKVLRVSSDQNPELFWAIRGGGGNFGVVTEFEFRLHDVSPYMYGGVMQWRLSDAKAVLDYYGEQSPSFSDEMFMAPGMTTGANGDAYLTMDICFCGDRAEAEKQLAPLRAVARPAIDGAVPTSYLTMQTRLDGALRPGIRSYIKSGMVSEFTPELIQTMLEAFEPGRGVIITSFATGGAIARVGERDTAWPHRNAHSMVAAVSSWSDPNLDADRRSSTRALWELLDPHTGGYYANIQADDIEVAGNYGPVYERLVSIKNDYDPLNLFRLNSNIRPTA